MRGPDEETTPDQGAQSKAEQRLRLFRSARGLTPTPPIVNGSARGQRARGRARVRAEVDAEVEFAQAHAETARAKRAVPMSAPAPPAGSTIRSVSTAVQPAVAGPAWRDLGPTEIPNGQTYGSGPGSRVNVSGRVGAIAVDPANANHVLVGSAGGGIWESFNNGASWAPRTDYQPTLTIGAVAFDPAEPATVYALTGEGNFYAALGAGLLRSVDGGTTWGMLATSPFVGQGGYRLVVDHGDTARLFAAASWGLYRSTDSGVGWTPVIAATAWDVSVSTAAGGEVLAACADGLHVSTDNGATWAAVALPGAPASWSRLAVAHAPSDGQTAYAWGASGANAYLWRRSAGTWAAVSLPAGVSVKQAWYDWYVAVSPDNSGQIYLGEINLWRGDSTGTTWTWTNISSKSPGSSIHPDQHTIAFVAGNANVIWAGCDGGIFRSDDRGVTWVACNTGIGITEFEYIAQMRGSAFWLLGGTQDNGTERYNGSSQWLHSQDGDGGGCGVDSGTTSTVFHSYYDMGMERSTQAGDWGTWQAIGPNIPRGYSSLFYPPVDVNGSTVAQAGTSLFVSTNDGGSFSEVALGLSAGAVASALRASTTSRIYVGSTQGDVVRADYGAAWTKTSLTGPAQGWVSSIAVHPGNASLLWLSMSSSNAGRVYRSGDGGSTWTDVTANLPALPANAVEVDPWNQSRAWVSLDVGVWQTLDGGATWAEYGLGLPNALVEDLLLQPDARLLRAATRNRGVWEIDADWPAVFPICGTQWTGTLAASQTMRWYTFNWPATWHILWTVMPTTAGSAPQVQWSVAVQRATPEFVTYWITVTNLTAAAVTFEGRYAILSRY